MLDLWRSKIRCFGVPWYFSTRSGCRFNPLVLLIILEEVTSSTFTKMYKIMHHISRIASYSVINSFLSPISPHWPPCISFVTSRKNLFKRQEI